MADLETNATNTGEETETNTNTETSTEETKTYTQDEVDALLQAEADRRVSQALKKQEKKNAEKVREAEKLAQMNEQEKYEYQLQQREKRLEEKERELALAENKNQASKILAEKGLNLSLVDFVVAEDAETMSTNISLLDKAFKASVKAEVEKRLSSSSPKKNFVEPQAMSKQELLKLPMRELSRLLEENPDLKQVIGG